MFCFSHVDSVPRWHLLIFPVFFSFCCLPGYSYQSTIYFSPNGVIIPARCWAAEFFARAARFLSVQATSAHNYLVAKDINEGRVTWKVELLIQRNINSLDWKSKFSSLIHILGAQLKKKEKKASNLTLNEAATTTTTTARETDWWIPSRTPTHRLVFLCMEIGEHNK